MYAISNKNAAAPKAAPQSLSSTAGGIWGCCGCGWATATAGKRIGTRGAFGFGTTNVITGSGSGETSREVDRVVDRTLNGDPPLDGDREGDRVSDVWGVSSTYAPGRSPGRTGECSDVVLT